MPPPTTPILTACRTTSAAIAARDHPLVLRSLSDLVSELSLYNAGDDGC